MIFHCVSCPRALTDACTAAGSSFRAKKKKHSHTHKQTCIHFIHVSSGGTDFAVLAVDDGRKRKHLSSCISDDGVARGVANNRNVGLHMTTRLRTRKKKARESKEDCSIAWAVNKLLDILLCISCDVFSFSSSVMHSFLPSLLPSCN